MAAQRAFQTDRRGALWTALGLLMSTPALAGQREFALPELRSLSVGLPCQLRIEQGAGHRMVVEAEADVLTALKLGIAGDQATLELSRPVQTRQSILVAVTLPRLSRLQCRSAVEASFGPWSGAPLTVALDGSTRLRFDRLEVAELSVQLRGASQLIGSGEVARQSFEIEGAGTLDTRAMRGQTVRVQISGSGDAVVRAERELDVRVSGMGNVRFAGQAKVRQDIQGLGSVTPL